MKTVAIIQARINSTRLPGKVLKKVLDKTLLEYQIEKLLRSKQIDEVIVATTTNDLDIAIVQLCEKLGISTYRGSEADVLSRYYEAARLFKADIILRITSDNPLIDIKIIDKLISLYKHNYDKYDYISNVLESTYPVGVGAEVFSFTALLEAFHNGGLSEEREHVTPYIYRHPEKFNILNVASTVQLSNHRWTVDTSEDFELVKRIIESLYPEKPHFNMEDVLELLQKHPEWSLINAHIEQKKLQEVKTYEHRNPCGRIN